MLFRIFLPLYIQIERIFFVGFCRRPSSSIEKKPFRKGAIKGIGAPFMGFEVDVLARLKQEEKNSVFLLRFSWHLTSTLFSHPFRGKRITLRFGGGFLYTRIYEYSEGTKEAFRVIS